MSSCEACTCASCLVLSADRPRPRWAALVTGCGAERQECRALVAGGLKSLVSIPAALGSLCSSGRSRIFPHTEAEATIASRGQSSASCSPSQCLARVFRRGAAAGRLLTVRAVLVCSELVCILYLFIYLAGLLSASSSPLGLFVAMFCLCPHLFIIRPVDLPLVLCRMFWRPVNAPPGC